MAKIELQNKPINNGHDFWWNKIKGIGQKRAEWLKNQFNIDSIDSFAALTVDEINTRVQSANNIRWRRDEIEVSLIKAREISAKVNIRTQQDAVSEKPKPIEISNSLNKEKGWEYLAAFNVEFKVCKSGGAKDGPKINVRPVEITKGGDWGDTKGEEPTLVEGERLYQWMLAQLTEEEQLGSEEEKLAGSKESRFVEKVRSEVPVVRMKIAKIQAFQPPEVQTPTITSQAGQPFLGYLVADQSFNIQVTLDLVGSGAKEILNKNTPYDVQFFARDFSIGKGSNLGTTEPETLVDNITSYKAKLTEVTLSSGMYRLQVLAKVKNTPPISDYLEIPLLQVI